MTFKDGDFIPETLVHQQLELEQWWLDTKHRDELSRMEKLRKQGKMHLDKRLDRLTIAAAEATAQWLEETVLGRPRGGTVWQIQEAKVLRETLRSITPFELSYLCISTVISSLFNVVRGDVLRHMTSLKPTNYNLGVCPLSSMQHTLVTQLEQEFKIRQMDIIAPDLQHKVRAITGKQSGLVHRQRVAKLVFSSITGGVKPLSFTAEQKHMLAKALTRLTFNAGTAELFELNLKHSVKEKKSLYVIAPTQLLYETVNKTGYLYTKWLTRSKPLAVTLTKPSIRSTPEQKQMLLTAQPQVLLRKNMSISEEAYREAFPAAYKSLYRVVHRLDQVPWRINKNLLSWWAENRDTLPSDLQAGQVPVMQHEECPVVRGVKYKDMSPEQKEKFVDWKRRKASLYRKFYARMLRREKFTMGLELAQKLAEYSKFYLLWMADFRGRLYCVNAYVSPMVGGIGTECLEFADSKTVTFDSPTDAAWLELKEHGLRLLKPYAKESQEKVLSAPLPTETPIELWQKGLLSDKLFLRYVVWWLDVIKPHRKAGESWSCHLPIRRDATCSSMQHMAGLAGCKKVLKAANCAGADARDKPRDLYSEAIPDYIERGLERDLLKKHVMTMAYNATKFSRARAVQAYYEESHSKHLGFNDAFSVTEEVEELTRNALGKIVLLQNWLMRVIQHKVVTKPSAEPDSWSGDAITPTGFVVVTAKKVPAKVGWQTHQLRVFDKKITLRHGPFEEVKEWAGLDLRKMARSWVANLIHSLDACLLHMLCLSMRHNNTPFATIHDCVMTLPGDMSEVVGSLRDGFKALYRPWPSNNLPAALHKWVEYWGLDTESPALYNESIKTFQAVDESFFGNLRYFFL